MSHSIESLLLELLGLPASMRAQLAAKLIASLEETEDPDAKKAWAEEIMERLKDYEEGKDCFISEEDAMRDARARLRSCE